MTRTADSGSISGGLAGVPNNPVALLVENRNRIGVLYFSGALCFYETGRPAEVLAPASTFHPQEGLLALKPDSRHVAAIGVGNKFVVDLQQQPPKHVPVPEGWTVTYFDVFNAAGQNVGMASVNGTFLAWTRVPTFAELRAKALKMLPADMARSVEAERIRYLQ
jgi:hypothetical protein